MVQYLLNNSNRVIAIIEGDILREGFAQTDAQIAIDDIYDPESKTFFPDPTVAIKAEILKIDAQIVDLEASQTRQLREIAIGLDTDGTAFAKLTASNTEIAALRTQRAALAAQL